MLVSEGKAKISVSEGVFYNPKMEINRDLLSTVVGVLDVKEFCDGHSASGIKAIRVKIENDCIESVDAVDLSRRACAIIEKNIELNNVKGITIINGDIRRVLMEKKYDFVEIDPFGTPAPYFASLAESFSWKRSGHFSITATDTAVLCGAEAKACKKIYGSVPFHNEFVHESALRILIARIQSIFAEKNLAVIPILSLSHRHYLKLFFEVKKSAVLCDKNLAEIKFMAYCEKCKHRKYIKPGDGSVCSLCGNKMLVTGPFWSSLLHDSGFLRKMIAEIEKRQYRNVKEELKLLNTLMDENFDGFCFELHTLFRGGKTIPKTTDILSKLRSMGFKAASTSYKNWIIRTNASVKEII